MTCAIMQPYFFPYIGYFQLLNVVDTFVIYDNIEYTKKGWVNRNRILINGKDQHISLTLKKDSDYLTILERELSENWIKERIKMLNRIKGAYSKAPYFNEIFPVIEKILLHEEKNLFFFLLHSIQSLISIMEITTNVVISSTIGYNNELKGKDKVIEICNSINSNHYINPVGGLELYKKEEFLQKNIKLEFLKSKEIEYRQFGDEFVPFLSIIDVLMFNSIEETKSFLNNNYTLI